MNKNKLILDFYLKIYKNYKHRFTYKVINIQILFNYLIRSRLKTTSTNRSLFLVKNTEKLIK
jgi:hypothetical protein